MTAFTMERARESIRELFLAAEDESRRKSKAIGAELEMIPVCARTGQRVLAQTGTPSGTALARAIADDFGWTEEEMGSDPSCWNFPEGRLTFEPGGQIELSSAVFSSASQLIDSMQRWTAALGSVATRHGVELLTRGIDARNPIDRVPLQLHRERYEAMTRYFESIGPYGVVMMRQTASLQINVDRGENPPDRWRLLNALAPYLVAIFANSPRYEAAPTGHKSYRAHVWRNLDPHRTGLPYGDDVVQHYMDFALDAPVILDREDRHSSFRALIADGSASEEMWEVHLSTLFPEIRPREYFEIRSLDANSPNHLPAAICLVAGIVYVEEFAFAAARLLGTPDPGLLSRAGETGLTDPHLRKMAIRLVELALGGCAALGQAYLAPSHIESAKLFFERYTLRGCSPADG